MRHGLSEMRQLSPGLLPCSITQSVCAALRPLMLIYGLAAMVGAFTVQRYQSLLPLFMLLIVYAILFFMEQILNVVCESKSNILYLNEEKRVSDTLTKLPYARFSSKELQEKIAAHKNARTQGGSGFQGILDMTTAWIRGLILFVFSLWMLRSFLHIALLIPIIFGGGLVALLSFIFNQKYANLRRQYIGVNRLFRYNADLLSDPKTGKEIRLFEIQPLILRQATNDIINKGLGIQRKIVTMQGLSSAIYALLGAALGGFIYFFLGAKGLENTLSAEQIVCCAGALLQVVQAFMLLGENMGRLRSAVPELNYYFELAKHQEQDIMTIGKIGSYRIEFRNVSFRYPGSEDYTLRDISLIIEPGETLAIVGENGSGKTTFVQLLCRLLEPQEGEILLGEVNISKYPIKEYYALLSVVFQDFTLFDFSLRENIACGINFDVEYVKKLLKNIYLSDELWGTKLSGGESQKAAIARALYRDAPIVIFDEPTAALDPFMEREIYHDFAKLTQDKTAIYISHRLASCRFCERVLVFDNGKIVEDGTHEDLLWRNRKYSQLWAAQKGLYDIE